LAPTGVSLTDNFGESGLLAECRQIVIRAGGLSQRWGEFDRSSQPLGSYGFPAGPPPIASTVVPASRANAVRLMPAGTWTNVPAGAS
jgi:hypothetical protein